MPKQLVATSLTWSWAILRLKQSPQLCAPFWGSFCLLPPAMLILQLVMHKPSVSPMRCGSSPTRQNQVATTSSSSYETLPLSRRQKNTSTTSRRCVKERFLSVNLISIRILVGSCLFHLRLAVRPPKQILMPTSQKTTPRPVRSLPLTPRLPCQAWNKNKQRGIRSGLQMTSPT